MKPYKHIPYVKYSIEKQKEILLFKYGITPADPKDFYLEDEEREYDECSNNWWTQIRLTDGGRYFKFWGMNESMDYDCVEVFRKTRIQEYFSEDEYDIREDIDLSYDDTEMDAILIATLDPDFPLPQFVKEGGLSL